MVLRSRFRHHTVAVILTAVTLFLGTGAALVAALYSSLTEEVDLWAGQSLDFSARARLRLIDEYLAGVDMAAEQIAVGLGGRGWPEGEPDEAAPIDARLREVLQRGEVEALALRSSDGLQIRRGRLLGPADLAGLGTAPEPRIVDGAALFLTERPILDAAGREVARLAIGFGVTALADRFDDDLGLGPGVQRRLLGVVGDRLVQLLPAVDATIDWPAARWAPLSPEAVERALELEEGIDGVALTHAAAPLVVVIDFDEDSYFVERRARVWILAGVLGGVLVLVGVGMAWMLAVQMKHTVGLGIRLEAQAEELARSNEELDRYAAVVSHDLQAPLRRLVVNLDLLESTAGAALGERSAAFLERCRSSALELRAMVSSALDLARFEQEVRDREPVAAGEAVLEAMDQLGEELLASGGLVCLDRLPRVLIDRVHLVRLFQNLIGNAVKYAGGARPRIEIGAVPVAGGVALVVRDNGPGIPGDVRDRLFEPFQRAREDRPVAGLGLGLATCRRIVEAAGGRIWVDSTAGAGSAFYLLLPPASPHRSPSARTAA